MNMDSSQNQTEFDKDSNQNLCDEEDRRRKERRNEPSNGFCQISVVGWIDRRERCRRKGDKYIW